MVYACMKVLEHGYAYIDTTVSSFLTLSVCARIMVLSRVCVCVCVSVTVKAEWNANEMLQLR